MTEAHILHVFKYFRPAFTGEGVFVERLAPRMRRLRPDVAHEVLVTATPQPDQPVAIPGISQVHYLSSGASAASQGALVAWFARNASRYAVVHHHTHVDRTFLGALALKMHGVRIILSATLDDSIPRLLSTYRAVLRPLVRRLFGLIDCFVAISPKLQEENRGYAPRRSVLVPMGVPLAPAEDDGQSASRRRLALPHDACILVSVGGLCARKDQLSLIRDLAPILKADPRRRLILVGPVVEADYAARLRAEITRLGLSAQVDLAGFGAPSPFYAAADIFVFASRQEGFGTVVLEAMAHGLPVVVRRLAGVNDTFVDHGFTGLLFTDAEELTRHVQALLDDSALARRLGAQAKDAARRFDIDATAARYLELYAPQLEHAP